jgi:hypothetical protein
MYLNDWKNSGEAGMLEDFGIDKSALEGAHVLLASYTYEDYSGKAFVLYRRDGKLYEVNGGHCSCYGLRDQSYYEEGEGKTQWEPEETSKEALEKRIDNDYTFDGMRDELRAVLATL